MDIQVSKELLNRIDSARGDDSRQAFIRKIIIQAVKLAESQEETNNERTIHPNTETPT